MLSQLEGRVAVVTGAGSGIGAALCRRLSAEGMRVVAGDIDARCRGGDRGHPRRRTRAGRRRRRRRRRCGGSPTPPSSAFGQVDLLCNNAGVFQGGLSWERSEGDWDWVLGVNLYGIVHGISSFVPRMIAQGTEGHVVNTASVASFVSGPFSSPYIVSKTAALGAVRVPRPRPRRGRVAHRRLGAGAERDRHRHRPHRPRPTRSVRNRPDPRRSHSPSTSSKRRRRPGWRRTRCAGRWSTPIRTGTFLIPTRPSYADQLRSRFDALVERQLPPMPLVD